MLVLERKTVRGLSFQELSELERELLGSGFLLLSEVTPTYTRGFSASESELLNKDIPTAAADRGGKWTYHGPGQLLAYPLIRMVDLGLKNREVRKFTEVFLEGVLSFCQSYIPQAQYQEPFGIYVQGRKLASFGMAFHQGVVSGGVAVYLTPQAQFFGGIIPCGTKNQLFTSFEELGVGIEWDEAAGRLSDHIKISFQKHIARLF